MTELYRVTLMNIDSIHLSSVNVPINVKHLHSDDDYIRKDGLELVSSLMTHLNKQNIREN